MDLDSLKEKLEGEYDKCVKSIDPIMEAKLQVDGDGFDESFGHLLVFNNERKENIQVIRELY